jgi:hypothetical protein
VIKDSGRLGTQAHTGESTRLQRRARRQAHTDSANNSLLTHSRGVSLLAQAHTPRAHTGTSLQGQAHTPLPHTGACSPTRGHELERQVGEVVGVAVVGAVAALATGTDCPCI